MEGNRRGKGPISPRNNPLGIFQRPKPPAYGAWLFRRRISRHNSCCHNGLRKSSKNSGKNAKVIAKLSII
jgi:hypothetical protein